ncbi:MAG TPA: hypothetical protein VEJ87_15975 [Acidimicrobiales bacterium]|nr:hypothetical protein [Acidimicrobiales bacterium]
MSISSDDASVMPGDVGIDVGGGSLEAKADEEPTLRGARAEA